MKSTILVLDDNSATRTSISEILELADYRVLQAQDGKAGLEVARSNQIDLIICDITMPVLDGYGVLLAIQNNPDLQSIPFIFMTCKSQENLYRTAMDLGADDFLVKPFSGESLLKVVASHLRKIEILRRALDKKRGVTGEFEEEAADAKDRDQKSERHHVKQYAKGEYMYHEGDRAENLYFIVSGKVKTSKINYWGKEFITDIFKEGDYFGYLALLDSHKYEESAMAIDPSRIEIIPRKDFFDLLHTNGSVADSFIKMISQKLDISHEKLLSLAYDSARKKVAEALLYIHRKYQITGANELAFPVKREIISSIAGLSPESVSRNLTEMSQEGLIKVYDRKIKIIDRKKLEDIRN